jgi:hydroxysqualene dehydroxylase
MKAETKNGGASISESSHLRVTPSQLRVAIIGGGYAGLAAAVELASRNIHARVFEAGPTLGGRARCISYQNIDIDNGAHILLGAYEETLRVMQIAGVSRTALLRLPLQLAIKDSLKLFAAPLPSPLHLLVGLLTAKGLTIREQLAAIRFMATLRRSQFRLANDMTVSTLLIKHGQNRALAKFLWELLCIAALNTLPEEASAQIFLHVLCDSLAGRKQDSELRLPRVDLSRLFPEQAAAYVK